MRFVFVGNRIFVLEEMFAAQLDLVEVLVVQGTHLERDVKTRALKHKCVSSKTELLLALEPLEFDILVSNGCPFILPVSSLPPRQYVNVHPSYLPDLRGVDPVLGALLFERDAGATVHVMNDSIDAGDIISQVRIPHTSDLDAALLYQLSFIAEKMAFRSALARGFRPQGPQVQGPEHLYYSRKPEDRQISFAEPARKIVNKVRAFSNVAQGCLFECAGKELKVHQAQILENPFVVELARNVRDRQIMLCYEDCLVFKREESVLRFSKISGDLTLCSPGVFVGKDQQ